MSTTPHAAFELGMHLAFKKAGVTDAKQASGLFKIAEDLLARRRYLHGMSAAYELGLRKTAADHGLLTIDEQDAFVEAARKVAAKKIARTKVAGLATLIGAGVGAGRKKDPGESRGQAIARSAGTGLATDVGSGVGAATGALAGGGLASLLHKVRNVPTRSPQHAAILKAMSLLAGGLYGAGAGAVAGGTTGFNLARRRPENKQALLESLKAKLGK